MSDVTAISGNRIRSFVERIEQLETEIQELNDGKKEVFSEAKGEGFDVKILREIIKLRKQDQDERDEHETLLDVYMRAMESAPQEQNGKGSLTAFPARSRRFASAILTGGLSALRLAGRIESAAMPEPLGATNRQLHLRAVFNPGARLVSGRQGPRNL